MSIAKAIDTYIEKVDNELTSELASTGFVRASETVRNINTLEERLAAALKAETAFIRANLRSAVDLEVFAQSWSQINDFNVIDDRLAEIFFDSFATNIPRLATAYIKQTDPWLAVTQLTNRTIAWAKSWSQELGRIMKLASHRQMESLLTTALAEGQSVMDFTRHLMTSGIRNEYYRARSTALTEMLTAHSAAAEEALQQNPACEGKEWVHTGNHKNKPRENHEEMSGVIVRKDEMFMLIGADGGLYETPYPRHPSLPPGERINCHCIHRAVINENVLGLSLEERKRLQSEIIAMDY